MTVSKLPEIDADKAAAVLCKRRLSYFVKEFWDVVVAEDLVWSWHMDVLCDEIQAVYERVFLRDVVVDGKPTGKKYRLPKLYDLVINIPPGTSKSTICTIMAPVWGWTRDPTLRFITGSYSGDLSVEHSQKSKDIVESDRFRLYFPEIELKGDKSGKTNYENTKLGQRYAASVGGSVTGIHAHIISVDDPLNAKQATSDADTETANAWMDATLSLRKVDKAVTPTILIMQRLASTDPTGHLLAKKKENLRHVCLPAELSVNVKPAELSKRYINGLLDPVRLNRSVLADSLVNLGSSAYAGQMSQRPAPAGGLIWKKWFKEIDDSVFPDINQATQVGSDWDLAYTKDDTNAASAYITAGKIDNKAFIWDFDFAWLEYPELLRWIKTKKAPHYIENKASGKSAKQSLTRAGIIAIELKMTTGDKIARAKMATPPVEAGLVYIKKSLADRLYNDDKQGILNFPKNQYKDVADVLSQSMQRLFSGGIIVASGTRTALDEL